MPLAQSTTIAQGNGLCLLSLDAGGQRAISQLKILDDLMHKLSSKTDSNEIYRPCDVFDMIAGVGSGGFIAILLVVFGLTAEQALTEIIELTAKVLDPQRDTSARTIALREHIYLLIDKYKVAKDMRLMELCDNSNHCKCVVPLSYKHHVESNCTLRNFVVRQEQPLNCTIVDALLTTLSTPPLFTPVSIFNDAVTTEYIGGDIKINNPIREIISEAHEYFGPETEVASLISIGCGHPGVTAVPNNNNMATWNTFLGRLIANGEREAQIAEAQMGHLDIYHRFSVETGLETSSALGMVTKERCIATTVLYMEDGLTAEKANRCAESIQEREGTATLEQLKRFGGERVLPSPLSSPTETFIMRQEPWNFIESVILNTDGAGDSNRSKILVVTGMGGCGKTQLIRKFAQVYAPSFTSVFFFDGSSEARIRADLVQNVHALGPQHSQLSFEGCLNFLAQPAPESPRLIIYDNVDDPELKLLPLLPSGSHCAIIITSRNRSLGQLNRNGHLELDVMSIGEAVELLVYPLNRHPPPTMSDINGARAVAEELGCLPIALVQARSHMFQTSCSASTYLERLVSSQDRLLALPVYYQRDMRHNSTYSAFDASFQVLPAREQKFLHLLSFFHWNKFPLELVSLAAKHGFSSYNTHYIENEAESHNAKGFLRDIFHQDGKFETIELEFMAITLQNYSLITLAPGIDTSLVQIHPLVHRWVNLCIPPCDRDDYLYAAFSLLALGQRKEYTPSAKYLPSHVIHFSPLWDRLPLNESVAFGRILHDAGLYGDALKLRQKIVQDLEAETRPSKLPPKVSAINLRSDLAANYRRLGRYSEAEAIQLDVLKVKREILGEAHADTVTALSNLALTYVNMKKLGEAMASQEEVVRLSKEALGERHVDTISSMANLAATYFDLRRFDNAIKLQEEVRKLDKETLGMRHHHAIGNASSLALAYREVGRLNEAEELQEEVVRLRKEMQGDDHPKTVKAMPGLAKIYKERGKTSEAQDLCSSAEAIIFKTLGEAHPQYQRCKSIKSRLRDTRAPVSENAS